MKRTFRIFLFAAILAAFLMGCSPLLPVSPSGETAVPSEPSAPPATTAPTEAPMFDDSVLGEAYTTKAHSPMPGAPTGAILCMCPACCWTRPRQRS